MVQKLPSIIGGAARNSNRKYIGRKWMRISPLRGWRSGGLQKSPHHSPMDDVAAELESSGGSRGPCGNGASEWGGSCQPSEQKTASTCRCSIRRPGKLERFTP